VTIQTVIDRLTVALALAPLLSAERWRGDHRRALVAGLHVGRH
jgi:hypothetical protein